MDAGSLVLVHRGKVRDVYDAGDDRLLLVASDRISAFDVVLSEPIPDKGRVLTLLSDFWFDLLADVAPNHRLSVDPGDFPPGVPADVPGRAMLVRRAEMLPIECIVRGYLAGSAWVEYRRTGTVHGEAVPAGLEESAALPEPVFTPSTKASAGHDENISRAAAAALVGTDVAREAEAIALAAYARAAAWAADRGILIADTKFELGFIDGHLALCDEVLTPDSSRFWPAAEWHPGAHPPSFDKQPVRDWLEQSGWDKRPPPPALPAEIVAATSARYAEVFRLLTGRSLAATAEERASRPEARRRARGASAADGGYAARAGVANPGAGTDQREETD
jgi:phosphoribosylaminoimidazole-succinocarboxamide synthase